MGAGCMPVHACTCVRPGCVYNIHVCICTKIFQGMALSIFMHVKLIHEHIIPTCMSCMCLRAKVEVSVLLWLVIYQFSVWMCMDVCVCVSECLSVYMRVGGCLSSEMKEKCTCACVLRLAISKLHIMCWSILVLETNKVIYLLSNNVIQALVSQVLPFFMLSLSTACFPV